MSDPTLKTWATCWRLLLRHGLTTAAEIKAWADDRLARLDRPPGWLIDVSLAVSADQLREALAAPGWAEPGEGFEVLAAELAQRLRQQPADDLRIAHLLAELAHEQALPAAVPEETAHDFVAGLEGAYDGIWGDVASERERLAAFLTRWAQPPATSG